MRNPTGGYSGVGGPAPSNPPSGCTSGVATRKLELYISKFVPEDGDIIVITTPRCLKMDQREILYERVSTLIKSIGKRVQCPILEDGMGIQVLNTSKLPDAEAA